MKVILMGERISISFLKHNDNDDEIVESVALFSHWEGRRMLAITCAYLVQLHAANRGRNSLSTGPLDRLEPPTVIVDFIRWMSCFMPRVARDLSLGPVERDGNNTNHGHFTFDLDQWRFTEHDTGRTYSISGEARRTVRQVSDSCHGITSANKSLRAKYP